MILQCGSKYYNQYGENYIRFSLATAKRHAARFPRAYIARRTIKIIVAVPILRALDAATLQLQKIKRQIFIILRYNAFMHYTHINKTVILLVSYGSSYIRILRSTHLQDFVVFCVIVGQEETRRNFRSQTRTLSVRDREVRKSRSKYSLRFGIFCIIGSDMINRGRISDEYHERVWISNAVINNSDGAGYSAGAILNTRFKGSFDKKGRKDRPVRRHRDNKRKRKKDLAVRSRVLRQGKRPVEWRELDSVGKEAWSRSKSPTFIKPQYLSSIRARNFYSSFSTTRMCPHWLVR